MKDAIEDQVFRIKGSPNEGIYYFSFWNPIARRPWCDCMNTSSREKAIERARKQYDKLAVRSERSGERKEQRLLRKAANDLKKYEARKQQESRSI